MKKALCIITTIVMLVTCMFVPNLTAYAANISLGVSSSSIQIGDSVTVTVSVPENVTGPIYLTFSNDILEFSSASVNDVSVNGGNINISIGKYGLAGTNKVTLTFKAKTSGTASVKASHGDLYNDNTFEEVTLGSASTTITVANKTSNSGNGGGTSTDTQKSGDNSLSSLKLSKGTLSPSFKYNVTKYTATVEYDVTTVVVSAKTSNANATIESVTGDGTVNLKVGENTIKVVVKAENGVKATYTIVVTRKEKATTTEPQPTESESQSQSETTTTPQVNEALQWNGEQLQVPESIPVESVPADFESTSLVVNGQQMQGLSFGKGDLKVLYLNNTNGAGSLYVYDEEQQTIYPFIKLESEKSYVMVLVPEEDKAPAPSGFESCTFSIEGKGVVNAYQLKEKTVEGTEEVEDSTMTWNIFCAETFYAAEAQASDFYLIYCMNNNGEKGWYMYDSVEETFQRYLAIETDVETSGDVSGSSVVDGEKYAELEEELKMAKMAQYISMGVAVVLVIILIIVLVVAAMKKRSNEEDFFEDYEEDEYEEEYEDEEAVDEDDEIEIEFYNMEERVIEEAAKPVDEDDGDLEFVDFE